LGGLLANPGVILAHALATITSPKGAIKVRSGCAAHAELGARRARRLHRRRRRKCPEIDPDWGEPGFTPSEKVFGWCSFEVLAFTTGNPETRSTRSRPRRARPCQIRFVVGVDPENFMPALRRHLDAHDFPMVQAEPWKKAYFPATRLDPDTPGYAGLSLNRTTTGKRRQSCPNLGGSLPNDIFADDLGMPTVWVPIPTPPAPNTPPTKHLLAPVAREALKIMTASIWDLGEQGVPAPG